MGWGNRSAETDQSKQSATKRSTRVFPSRQSYGGKEARGDAATVKVRKALNNKLESRVNTIDDRVLFQAPHAMNTSPREAMPKQEFAHFPIRPLLEMKAIQLLSEVARNIVGT